MKILAIGLLLGLFVSVVAAQDECSAIVAAAVEAASDNCSELGEAQACYGNVVIDAEAQPEVTNFAFDTAGDIANLTDIASMRLNSRVEESGEWGISMVQVAAITPTGTEDVRLVLFGNVEVTDPDMIPAVTTQAEVPTATPIPVTLELTTGGKLNVRSGPSTNNAVITSLKGSTTVVADGRNEAGDWARFQLDDGGYGWVYVPLMSASGDVMSLAVVEATGQSGQNKGLDPLPPPPEYAPMQAFRLQSINGLSDRPCESAPDSGLLIQTPQGQGRITLRINEVLVDLGSTAFIQAAANDDMLINVIDGLAIVSVQGTGVVDPISGALGPVISTAVAGAGMRVRVAMDASLRPVGDPIAEPYEQARLLPLPVNLVPTTVEVVEAAAPFDGVIQTGTWDRRGIYTYYPCGDVEASVSERTVSSADLAGFAEEQRTSRYASNYDADVAGTLTTILRDEIVAPDTWIYHFNYWVKFLPGDRRPNYGTAHRWDFRYEYKFLTSTHIIETVTGIFNYCPGFALVQEWTYKGV